MCVWGGEGGGGVGMLSIICIDTISLCLSSSNEGGGSSLIFRLIQLRGGRTGLTFGELIAIQIAASLTVFRGCH